MPWLEADLVDGFFQHGERIARAVLVAVFPRGLFLLAVRPAAYSFAHVFEHAGGAQALCGAVPETVHRCLVGDR